MFWILVYAVWFLVLELFRFVFYLRLVGCLFLLHACVVVCKCMVVVMVLFGLFVKIDMFVGLM